MLQSLNAIIHSHFSVAWSCEERKLNSDYHGDIERTGFCDVLHSESKEFGTVQKRHPVCGDVSCMCIRIHICYVHNRWSDNPVHVFNNYVA